MKILFANARPPYPFIIGGDGVNIHTYFTYLAKKGHDCTWLGTTIQPRDRMMPGEKQQMTLLQDLGFKPSTSMLSSFLHSSTAISYSNNYHCYMVHPRLLGRELQRTIYQEKPDIVITQLERSDLVISEASRTHIPSVMFLTDGEKESISLITNSGNKKPTGIVCVSEFVKSRVPKLLGVRMKVFYPPISSNQYVTQASNDGAYITCVNPVRMKGGEVLENIIQKLPRERFLIVKGWYDPIDDGLDFKKYSNVLVMEKQYDMRVVYKKTKILLVPSLWDEPIPRVILEAGVTGIPSIASKRGGIPEALGPCGTLVSNPLDADEWILSINQLNTNKRKYQQASKEIKRQSQLFDIDTIGPLFEQWICSLI